MLPFIGVATGHREQLAPEREGYELFFDLLGREHFPVRVLGGRIESSSLEDCCALLIGDPRAHLGEDEIRAVLDWVQRGGSLLVSSSAGGDVANGTNLQALLPGIKLGPGSVDEWRHHRESFNHTRFPSELGLIPPDVLPLLSRTRWFTHGQVQERERASISGAWFSAFSWGSAPPEGATLYAEAGTKLLWETVATFYRPGEAFASKYPRLVVAIQHGKGQLMAVGETEALRPPSYVGEGSDDFERPIWLLSAWLGSLTSAEVARRQTLPQRHRLLHGYPMSKLLRRTEDVEAERFSEVQHKLNDANRSCVVGVLPHPFCNPAVRGCGFCTFPQQSFRRDSAEHLSSRVAREIELRCKYNEWQAGKPVDGIYFGGGTANLIPADSLRTLCRTLREHFRTEGAEITLEGVPIYFVAKRPSLLEVLCDELPARSRRISMGIQTFDPKQLERMGRTAFGDRAVFERVVREANALGYATSGDLLFDLPGQGREQMLTDVDAAVALGLDQVCLYHLVMFEGLGTEWSKDRTLMASLPSNIEACENWLAVRARLLGHGFEQVTLTNFERRSSREAGRSFRYEPAGFSPETHDLIGFGPSGITMASAGWPHRMVKWLNPESAAEYDQAVARAESSNESCRVAERFLVMDNWDTRLLYLTRKVALLGFSRASYRSYFHADPFDDFPHELEALVDAGLLSVDDPGDRVSLTPKGMFYGDTVAGTLAWRQVQHMRSLEHWVQQSGVGWRNRMSYNQSLDSSLFDPMG
jgi:oxygen-independent coproporphyrinogen-3 oxidase